MCVSASYMCLDLYFSPHALISVRFGVIIIATSTPDNIFIYYSHAVRVFAVWGWRGTERKKSRWFALFVLLVTIALQQQYSQEKF